jgi:hypothetical protein
MHRENEGSVISETLRNGNPRGNPNAAPRCGAKTRAGSCCKSPAIRGKKRCRMHGGKSNGAPCGENHGKFKHGYWTKQNKLQRAEISALLKSARELVENHIN